VLDRLRTVHWAAEQLGHRDHRSTYGWLKRHGVPVYNGRFAESAFFAVFMREEPGQVKGYTRAKQHAFQQAAAQLEERRRARRKEGSSCR